MAKASVVLSFHEVLLHDSDVALLNGSHWLNDKIISFYLEYLEKMVFREDNDLMFISPEVTQCIKMVSPEEIHMFLEPQGITEKNFLFFALNDNDSAEAGGSHWSLLVYSKVESCFYHFDSSSGSNHNCAWEFASHIMKYFGRGGSINFINKECTQQTNGYDCGIHLICNTEMLAEHAKANRSIGFCNMMVKINTVAKRKEILHLISSLSERS